MSARTIFALTLAAAVAAGGAYWLTRGPQTGQAAQSVGPQGPKDAPRTSEPLTPVAPERTPTTDEPATTNGAASVAARDGDRKEAGAVLRKANEQDKELVRSLMKMHAMVDKDTSIKSSLDAPIPGTDDDSFFLKYGSFTRPQLEESLESLQAILVWQDEGPFENKAIEVLPPELVRSFELEIDWLQRYLAEN
ncbi:MAG: hypothetical protein IT454_17450 [Planctomycetes bacterium]|nr:hypothetical protein [Planctomycetota bacterium]